ncbi:MAG: hypothetical protein MJ228_03395 [Bacilli bacterium]|nr:hypothetical protein [Bacilli bacterium]
MQYEITRENLQFAYKKLKNYMYHYSSSNYLKKKMLSFESKWKNEKEYDEYFDYIARSLERLELKPFGHRLRQNDIRYSVYPKKDKVSQSNLEGISVDYYNLFLDMPIEFYLIDILFICNIYDRVSECINPDLSFGNVFSPELKKARDILKTPVLFENHVVNYNKWKNKHSLAIKKLNDDKAVLVKFDLKRCFYNFKFNMEEFISRCSEKKFSFINELEIEIHERYSKIVSWTLKEKIEDNYSLLPIGLLSSSVILNYYLSSVDEFLNGKCLSYGRFADDFMALCEYKEDDIGASSKCELLNKLFGFHLFEEGQKNKTAQLFVQGVPIPLELNEDKITFSIINKKGDKRYDLSWRDMMGSSTSFIENDSNRETLLDGNMKSLAEARSVIYSYDIKKEEKKEFVKDLSNAQLINFYPLWNSLFGLEDKEVLFDRICQAISKVDIADKEGYRDQETILKRLKQTLLSEAKVSLDMSKETNVYRKRFISDIKQKDLFIYLENSGKGQEERHKVFPLFVTKQEIAFYLQVHDTPISELKYEVNKMYSLVNYLKDDESCSYEYELVNENLAKIERKWLCKERLREKENVLVAVVNMRIEENKGKTNCDLYDYDLKQKFPYYLSIENIYSLIDHAKKEKADYIVFPEFAIPYDYAIDIINLCYKLDISLIGGLTHYRYYKHGREYAKNFTLVYSSPLKKPFIHTKRYMAPSERVLLEKNHIIGEDSSSPYFMINDGNINFALMTCYECTNINDRALFNRRNIDVVFAPVCNPDTQYFGNIVESFSRDISAYVIQSNINDYGDSRITGPFKTYKKDIVRAKGDRNHFYIVGELSFSERDERERFEEKLLQLRKRVSSADYFRAIDKHIKSVKNEIQWKTPSASVPLEFDEDYDDLDDIF